VRWPLFGRGRTTTKVEDAREAPVVEAPPAPPAPPAAEGAPRRGGFRFEDPDAGETSLQAAAPPPPAEDLAAVVRRKTEGRRPGLRVADRGVAPMMISGMRERAALYRLAAEQRAETAPDEALALWRGYLELCPADGEGWFVYGQCLADGGELDAAWNAFVEARRHARRHAYAAAALGYLCQARGDLEGALRYYGEAVDLAGDDAGPLLESLADAQALSGRAAEASVTRARLERLRADA
jgi:tetratricopeptide (TPR) repeat protein